MKFELQQMRNQDSGSIVNCSSLGGTGWWCGAWNLSCREARSHWVHEERGSRIDGARGIRVNAICPGLIWTPMADQMVATGQGEALKAMEKSIPMGRVGRPEEVADAVLWLSERCCKLCDWPIHFSGWGLCHALTEAEER